MQVFICYFGAFSCVKLKLSLMILSVMVKVLRSLLSLVTDFNKFADKLSRKVCLEECKGSFCFIH